MTGADNQQERLGYYAAGYVDGEGSFHVGVQKSPFVKFGYQLVPEFRVSQNSSRNEVLVLIKELLGCGYIKSNDRRNPMDSSEVLVVRNRSDLVAKVIPFFERYPLISSKREDFRKFAYIVRSMDRRERLYKKHLLVKEAFSMNGNGRYRKWKLDDITTSLESSETVRRTPKEG